MLKKTTSLPATVPLHIASGIRRLGEETLRDGWIDRQFRLTADLLHLRMRLDLPLDVATLGLPWALRLCEELEILKDALYEVSADALAPPLAPLLAPSAALLTHVWAIYAWTEGVVAWLVARIRNDDTPPDAREELPSMQELAFVVEELRMVLGEEHELLPRAREHVVEAYLLALAIEEELTGSHPQATNGDPRPMGRA
jgi:hypothetical protein